jgi:hypothetical protein
VQLSSALIAPAAWYALEARIVAGERVDGRQIARARGRLANGRPRQRAA